MNKHLEKVSYNVLFHKKKRVYIMRQNGGLTIYNESHQEIKHYDKEESRAVIRKLKIEGLLDE
jgi:hypothetical protein